MQSHPRSLCVVKLGGSLFDLPDLRERLDRLLKTSVQNQSICIIPGGGRFADEVRRLDAVHNWSAAHSHHLAVQTMGLTARMMAAIVPGFLLLNSLASASTMTCCVLDVSQLPELEKLPPSWEITSDSIAAWVASQLHASQLLLLKSRSPADPLPTLEVASQTGWVDAGFPRYARSLPLVSWVNLRSSGQTPSPWLCRGTVIPSR